MNKKPQVIINKVKSKPIESYLYSFPKVLPLNKTQSTLSTALPIKNEPIYEKVNTIKKNTVTKVEQPKVINLPTLKTNLAKKVKPETQLATKKIITRQSLNAQIKNIHKYIPVSNKPNIQSSQVKSIFNPSPALVTKSTTRSSEQIEQERKQQITSYSNNMTIKKDDEGNCTMKQDLSYVGMEGVATLSFKCAGKTKFERNFSQHMKSVMDRYK